VIEGAQRNDAATLLQALHEQANEPAQDATPGPTGLTGLTGRQRVVGLHKDLATEMTARVDRVEAKTAAITALAEKNHKNTQDKIVQLTEATFAITNYLAGVQGVDPMSLLDAATAGDVVAISAVGAPEKITIRQVQLQAAQSTKGNRAAMLAGVQAGKHTASRTGRTAAGGSRG